MNIHAGQFQRRWSGNLVIGTLNCYEGQYRTATQVPAVIFSCILTCAGTVKFQGIYFNDCVITTANAGAFPSSTSTAARATSPRDPQLQQAHLLFSYFEMHNCNINVTTGWNFTTSHIMNVQNSTAFTFPTRRPHRQLRLHIRRPPRRPAKFLNHVSDNVLIVKNCQFYYTETGAATTCVHVEHDR